MHQCVASASSDGKSITQLINAQKMRRLVTRHAPHPKHDQLDAVGVSTQRDYVMHVPAPTTWGFELA